MCFRVRDLQKIADFSVIINISVKTKFDVTRMLLQPIKLDENKVLTKILTQCHKKNLSKHVNVTQFCGIFEKLWKTKIFHVPVAEAKTYSKGFYDLFNLTYIFIQHQIFNLFLVRWSQCFQNGCTVQEESKKNQVKKESFSWKQPIQNPNPHFF